MLQSQPETALVCDFSRSSGSSTAQISLLATIASIKVLTQVLLLHFLSLITDGNQLSEP